MTGQLLVMALAGCLLGLCGGYPWGRWNGNRALDATWDQAYYEGQNDAYWELDPEPSRTEVMPVEALPPAGTVAPTGLVSLAADWHDQIAAELAPEALQDSAALQLDEGPQRDVPEPGRTDGRAGMGSGLATMPELDAGLGHASPYTGTPTPAQRRRDKHKQRGQYAPGDLPDPPTDVGAWWQEELEVLLRDGQSEWLTRNLAGVAA